MLEGVAIEDTATVRAKVNAAEETRVAGDLQDESPLMLVVVDANPGSGLVDGSEDAGLAVDGAHEIEGGIVVAGSGSAEAEGLDFSDAGEAGEGS